MKTDKGIILIALKHHYYGNMAFNMALSIKHTDPEMPVMLIHDYVSLGGLTQKHLAVFDIKHSLDSHHTNENTQPYRSKFFLYDLSPFERSIYIDVDGLWLPRMSATKLFESLRNVDFTMINEGYHDMSTGLKTMSSKYTFWMVPEKIQETFPRNKNAKTGKAYQLRSEFIYFKKCSKNKKFFDLALKVYDDKKLKVKEIFSKVPDEYGFNIASLLLAHYPHEENYTPVYWEFLHHNPVMNLEEMYHKYFAYSMGGHRSATRQEKLYNQLVKFYHNAAHFQFPWQWKNKINYAHAITK